MDIPSDISGVIVLDKSGRLLVIKGVVGKWSFPKGHRKEGETYYQAALREAKEEAGIVLDSEKERAFMKLKHGSYYIYRLSKNYTEIRLGNPTTPEEVLEVKWLNRKSLLKDKVNADLHSYLSSNYKARHPW